jgi:hypothetical protein
MMEYRLDVEFPVTKAFLPKFSITSELVVSGLPYRKFNDTFWPRRIAEIFDPASGPWSWIVEMVNHTLPQGAV